MSLDVGEGLDLRYIASSKVTELSYEIDLVKLLSAHFCKFWQGYNLLDKTRRHVSIVLTDTFCCRLLKAMPSS